ncbi:hypothetical protein ABZ404_37040 [Streptomyces sp. NPDC005878]|uniref:hypothetical protein n=1 Tax=Streptomyces sp. NPDC005878 TaxID=3157077 RepID=UPI0033C97E9C
MKGQMELPGMPPAPEVEQEPELEARTYWEHRGPGVWEEVTVRVRYVRQVFQRPDPFLLDVHTARHAPRNVLVERKDGTRDVRPVRLLRVRRPS